MVIIKIRQYFIRKINYSHFDFKATRQIKYYWLWHMEIRNCLFINHKTITNCFKEVYVFSSILKTLLSKVMHIFAWRSAHYCCYFCQPKNIPATHSPLLLGPNLRLRHSPCAILSPNQNLTEDGWTKELGAYLVHPHQASALECQTTFSNLCLLSWILYNTLQY